ncbi:MAG: T9SS type A sorting domain-containing protein [Bacteroidia bacterium]
MHIYTLAKKCFLSALILTGTSVIASAQNYTFFDGKEAVEVATNHEDEIAVHIKLRNNTTDTLELTWLMLENQFTGNDWKMVALCDPYLCHNNIPSTFNPPLYANTAGDSVSEFKMLATPTSNSKTSKMRIVVWETGKDEMKDTLTFTIDTRALSVQNLTIRNGAPTLSAYPNPAQKVLNFDIETFNNNQVEIYTLNGQKILTTNLNGATKSVNIESLPVGMYIARLQDKNGNIKISKFSKQ